MLQARASVFHAISYHIRNLPSKRAPRLRCFGHEPPVSIHVHIRLDFWLPKRAPSLRCFRHSPPVSIHVHLRLDFWLPKQAPSLRCFRRFAFNLSCSMETGHKIAPHYNVSNQACPLFASVRIGFCVRPASKTQLFSVMSATFSYTLLCVSTLLNVFCHASRA